MEARLIHFGQQWPILANLNRPAKSSTFARAWTFAPLERVSELLPRRQGGQAWNPSGGKDKARLKSLTRSLMKPDGAIASIGGRMYARSQREIKNVKFALPRRSEREPHGR